MNAKQIYFGLIYPTRTNTITSICIYNQYRLLCHSSNKKSSIIEVSDEETILLNKRLPKSHFNLSNCQLIKVCDSIPEYKFIKLDENFLDRPEESDKKVIIYSDETPHDIYYFVRFERYMWYIYEVNIRQEAIKKISKLPTGKVIYHDHYIFDENGVREFKDFPLLENFEFNGAITFNCVKSGRPYTALYYNNHHGEKSLVLLFDPDREYIGSFSYQNKPLVVCGVYGEYLYLETREFARALLICDLTKIEKPKENIHLHSSCYSESYNITNLSNYIILDNDTFFSDGCNMNNSLMLFAKSGIHWASCASYYCFDYL